MPPKNPSSPDHSGAALLMIESEIRQARELLERSDTEADRRLTDLEARARRCEDRLAELERHQVASEAASKAIEKHEARAGEGWGRIASWVGVGISILFGLGSAAWALFVRGEK